ncbi:hypothetical protein FSP39_008380, partial [Pinctada imbricata]
LVVIGNHAYVYGGENKPRVPIDNNMNCLDLKSLSWSVCEPKSKDYIPSPVNAASVAAVGSKIYVFGGRTGVDMGQGDTDQMDVFDTTELVWNRVEGKGDKPSPRSYHAMTSSGKMLYVFGGCGAKGRMSDLYAFDTETSTWEKFPQSEAIVGRGGAGLAFHNGNIYVVGGFVGKEVNDVHTFNITSRTWTQLSFKKDLPPISVFGIAVLKDTIVVINGETDPSDQGHAGAGKMSNVCYVHDTSKETKTWEKLEVGGDIPEPRAWFPASVVNEKQVLIFGGNAESNERLSDIYSLTLD